MGIRITSWILVILRFQVSFKAAFRKSESILSEMEHITQALEKNLMEKREISARILQRLDDTLEKADEIGEKMDLLLDFITAGDLPVVARIMLLAQVYLLLLRLNIGKILVILEEKSKEFEASARILLDVSASHYLKTDVVKMMIVYIVGRLCG